MLITRSTTTIQAKGENEVHHTVGDGQESSVEIAENSKGEPRITVKVYHADVDLAMVKAAEVYKVTKELLDASEGKKQMKIEDAGKAFVENITKGII
jgi:Holliday junction resolvasome RuvABC ATP-dependent DNA helicase subunit